MMMEPFHINRMYLITQELSMKRGLYTNINESSQHSIIESYPYNF